MNIVSKLHGVKLYSFNCIDSEKSSSTIFKKSLFGKLIPMNENVSWYLNHIYIAPFGYGISILTTISILFIIFGFIFRKKLIGKILFILGILDIIYTLVLLKIF
jgi:hypothetical protein